MNKRETGTKQEQLACNYLRKQGIIILEQNYRVRQGEIDIIGRDHETIVFFEVKYRSSNKMGNPEEAVNSIKQRQIARISLFYIAKNGFSTLQSYRYDVIVILGQQIKWYKNAFSYSG